jgi:hydrogenase nickel incorporation protein HypA/HybF
VLSDAAVHELSICQALVRQLRGISAQHGGGEVALVKLRIGPLSGIESAQLEQAFPLAAAGTPAARAVLEIITAPVRIHCVECGTETATAPNRLLCGFCGSLRTRLLSGDEMLLESVELELAMPAAAIA